MDLEFLKEFFALVTKNEQKLQASREKLQVFNFNSFTFFKVISPKSSPNIDEKLLVNYIKNFTYNFEDRQPDSWRKDSKFQLHPVQEERKMQDIMKDGVKLFIQKWGQTDKLNFDEFSYFFKERYQMPQAVQEVQFSTKKRFFELIEGQIQALLNQESFKKAVGLTYKNLEDLFQTLTIKSQITLEEIKNLFLMTGERITLESLERLIKRISFPMSLSNFSALFKADLQKTKFKKQTKIFYSSLKRKKQVFYDSDDNEDKFMTPNAKTATARQSSTKLTKGERMATLRRGSIEVSKFSQCPQDRKNVTVLEDILEEEQKFIQLKRQLLFKPGFDLELIYEKKGHLFQPILNYIYGSCNFTSFVRFIIPQDYEHKYLAFIKYQKNNKIDKEIQNQIDNLLDQYHIKEQKIEKWWDNLDKQMTFRTYCMPKDSKIPIGEMNRYFTERQCRILGDRMDPNKTGFVTLENFK